jgi:hypothetical protein
VQLTVSAAFRDKLEHARDLISHANPSRDLEAVLDRAHHLVLADQEKKKHARTKRPRRERAAKGNAIANANTTANGSGNTRSSQPGRVARADRREVFARDGLRCTYVSPDGRRCTARAFLELDHAEPRGLGGNDRADNLRVRCRAHNQLWAEQAYGREHVERQRHFCQQKRTRPRKQKRSRPAEPAAPALRGTDAVSPDIAAKVRRALTGLGFRAAAARRAVSDVAERHAGDLTTLSVEQVFVEAIQGIGGGRGVEARRLHSAG